jgi:hypothetical protein
LNQAKKTELHKTLKDEETALSYVLQAVVVGEILK